MRVGTKIISSLAVLGILSGASLYVNSRLSEVPKLEGQVQVLEQTVTQERQENARLSGQNNMLIERLSNSEHQVQLLNQELNNEKKTNQKLAGRSGSVISEELDGFQVTWYNDEGISGITKSGRHTQDGTTIAVDPSVIPLGTWVKIVFPDGESFVRRADDTGSAVNGRIIDIYKDSPSSDLLQLGRTFNCKVYILH